MGENFALASSGRLMTSSVCVLHFKYFPLSYSVVSISPACTVFIRWLQRKVSRTNTRRLGLRDRSNTLSMHRMERPSSLKSSKYPGYVSGISTFGPTFVGLRPSLILIGCARIWYFLPAFKNKAVLCKDGLERVGTPRLLYWPLTILAMAGSSSLAKSLCSI